MAYNFFTKPLFSISFKIKRSMNPAAANLDIMPRFGQVEVENKKATPGTQAGRGFGFQSRFCVYLRTIVKVAVLVTPL